MAMSNKIYSKHLKWLIIFTILSILATIFACEKGFETRPRLPKPAIKSPPPQAKPLIGWFVNPTIDANKNDPDYGKSWDKGFKTIQEAIDTVTDGQKIYVAAETYIEPNLTIKNKNNITLVGGYKKGELYEKSGYNFADDEWVVLDGNKKASSLVTISGNSHNINFLGGFVFENVNGKSAMRIEGTDKDRVKDIAIVHCRFEDNLHSGLAGRGIVIQDAENIRLDYLDAKNNTAIKGGFIAAQDSRLLFITGGNWNGNKADDYGGALYLQDVEDLTLQGQTITDNTAKEGGGIYLQAVKGKIANVNFIENKAQGDPNSQGGGLALFGREDFTIEDSSFIGNEADGPGGAIVAVDAKIVIDFGFAEISKNKAKNGDGGAINIAESTDVKIMGGKYTENSATENGGAIALNGVNNIQITDGVFTDQKAQKGGTIFSQSSYGKQIFYNLTIRNGVATAGAAGGLYINGSASKYDPYPGSEINITRSKFIGNTATGNGGAVLIRDINYEANFENTEFTGNRSDSYGGALALDGKTSNDAQFFIGQNTQFAKNTAAKDYGGGAIFIVFDETKAPKKLPKPPINRQLVFYNKVADFKSDNASGGNSGKYIRVTNHDVEDGAAPIKNEGLPVFLTAKPPLSYFIAYSIIPADENKDWNQLGLGGWSSASIYVW